MQWRPQEATHAILQDQWIKCQINEVNQFHSICRENYLHLIYWNTQTLQCVVVQALTMGVLRKNNVEVDWILVVRKSFSGHSAINVLVRKSTSPHCSCEYAGVGIALRLSTGRNCKLRTRVGKSPNDKQWGLILRWPSRRDRSILSENMLQGTAQEENMA